jgi:hypothetical protein
VCIHHGVPTSSPFQHGFQVCQRTVTVFSPLALPIAKAMQVLLCCGWCMADEALWLCVCVSHGDCSSASDWDYKQRYATADSAYDSHHGINSAAFDPRDQMYHHQQQQQQQQQYHYQSAPIGSGSPSASSTSSLHGQPYNPPGYSTQQASSYNSHQGLSTNSSDTETASSRGSTPSYGDKFATHSSPSSPFAFSPYHSPFVSATDTAGGAVTSQELPSLYSNLVLSPTLNSATSPFMPGRSPKTFELPVLTALQLPPQQQQQHQHQHQYQHQHQHQQRTSYNNIAAASYGTEQSGDFFHSSPRIIPQTAPTLLDRRRAGDSKSSSNNSSAASPSSPFHSSAISPVGQTSDFHLFSPFSTSPIPSGISAAVCVIPCIATRTTQRVGASVLCGAEQHG